MKYKSQLISSACIAALALCIPLAASAATKKAGSPDPEATASPTGKGSASPTVKTAASPATAVKAPSAIPFHGKISAVDRKAKTFTIKGLLTSRVFKITGKTVIKKAGASATMKDVVAGEEVAGSYWKNADGSLDAKTVKLGPPTAEEQAKKDAAKAKRGEEKAEKKVTPSPSSSASPSPSASPTVSPEASPSATPQE